MSNVVFYSIRPYPIFSNFSRSMINIIHLDPFWIPEKIYFHVIKRYALFLKNGGIEIPFFFFFLNTSNTITRHLITRLEIRFRCNHRETFGAWTAGQTERLPMNNGRCDAQSCAHNFRKTRIV